ncbi:TetR/AcrR family transcriptional regulator [Halobacillus salinarum]|uniref:TetR/AcrR family transcriptional regulator n=1 Tax=Halobacillus salinarum TaxID=2932257 RepID=A0ABY4EFL4_9BACI|nr:TetR/AcrR family transcriptional regulator [Halobacillus salinarum]UOQ43266.1 TetR/AcrR family transcriptional regulator [Halobacillus salinarum]
MKKLQTRHIIIRVARDLFMEYGYRAVSTRQIADTCGITQPALYHHFSGKEELYVEVIRSVANRTKAAMQKILDENLAIDDCLYKIVVYMIDNHPEDLTQMFHDIHHELPSESRDLIEQWWHEAYLHPMIEIFTSGFEKGFLRDPLQSGFSPAVSARLFMTLINDSLSTEKYKSSQDDVGNAESTAKKLVSFFLYGFASEHM